MEHQEVGPPAVLRNAIVDFWYVCRDGEQRNSTFEVVPDGHAEIIFLFGSACRVSTPDGWQLLPSPFLVGLLQQPVLFQAEDQLEIIGVKCFPWALLELLGWPPGKGGGVRRLAHPIAQLQAPLSKCLAVGNVVEALALVTDYFVRVQAPMASDGLLGKAGGAMRAAKGALPVSQVAAAAYATVRTLERKFKQAAGHTVKGVSALMRFEQARARLWLHPTASLAGLAQELGYADQSHLGREFKRYSGTTAAAFVRQARSWQRSEGTDFVACILA